MIYSVGDTVMVRVKIARKIEDADGVSYDVSPDEQRSTLNMLRVKDKDIRGSTCQNGI